jgi:hypothetical protein
MDEILKELRMLYHDPTQGPSGDKFGQAIDRLMEMLDDDPTPTEPAD